MKMRFLKTQSALLLGSALLLTGCATKSATPAPNPTAMPDEGQASAAPQGGTFLNEKLPANILDLPFVAADGKNFTLRSLKGQTVVLANFLTSCQEICPMTTANMRDIADAVAQSPAKSKVKVLEVTVDAATDTPARLSAYQDLYQEKSWTMATSSAAHLDTFWNYLGAPAERQTVSATDAANAPVDWQTGKPVTVDYVHQDLVVIFGPDGTWRWLDLGSPKTKDGKIPTKLQAFLTKDGKANLAKPEEPTWSIGAVLSALSTITGTSISA